jgi:hypothetical protein
LIPDKFQTTPRREALIAWVQDVAAGHKPVFFGYIRRFATPAERLPADARDAYFELVGYPVAITTAANERYFLSELARANIAWGHSPEANHAAAVDAESRVVKLTARYNNEVAGGKWRNILTVNGVSPTTGNASNVTPPRPAPAADNVAPPAPPNPGALPFPRGARRGDFVERRSRSSESICKPRDLPTWVHEGDGRVLYLGRKGPWNMSVTSHLKGEEYAP